MTDQVLTCEECKRPLEAHRQWSWGPGHRSYWLCPEHGELPDGGRIWITAGEESEYHVLDLEFDEGHDVHFEVFESCVEITIKTCGECPTFTFRVENAAEWLAKCHSEFRRAVKERREEVARQDRMQSITDDLSA